MSFEKDPFEWKSPKRRRTELVQYNKCWQNVIWGNKTACQKKGKHANWDQTVFILFAN